VDACKSNIALNGLPQQLMREAAKGVALNTRRHPHWVAQRAWGTTVQKSWRTQQILLEIRDALYRPQPKIFRPKTNKIFTLQSDASDMG